MWFHYDYEEYDQYDEDQFCSRCGRDSHSIESCFATFTIDGTKIFNQQKTSKKNQQMACNRCGHLGHFERDCFATYTIDGTKIYEQIPSIKNQQMTCNRCGNPGHFERDCFANFAVDGRKINNQSPICRLCGYQGHAEKNCNFDISEDEIEEIGNFEESDEVIVENGHFFEDSDDEWKPDRQVTIIDQKDSFFQQCWYFLVKENVENIPNSPGVYELSYSKRDTLPVCAYVGHSGNLKERLQDHLYGERITPYGMFRKSNIQDEKSFTESKGFHFSFRYILCKSKGHAECIEQSYLSSFNYMWNLKDNNKQERIMDL
jgi:hypothetical protein